MAHLAYACWFVGEIGRAHALMTEAMTAVKATGGTPTYAHLIAFEVALERARESAQGTLRSATELEELSRALGMPTFIAAHHSDRGVQYEAGLAAQHRRHASGISPSVSNHGFPGRERRESGSGLS